MLSKHSLNEQVLVLRGTATKKANSLNSKNEANDEEHDHPKGAGHFDEEQAAVLCSETDKQAPLDAKVSFECMDSRRNPADFYEKKLRLQLTSTTAYHQRPSR